jgi:hypothetical protein
MVLKTGPLASSEAGLLTLYVAKILMPIFKIFYCLAMATKKKEKKQNEYSFSTGRHFQTV